MTRKLSFLFIICVAVAFGQASLTKTTLSSAISTGTNQTIFVASATGITASPVTMLYVDREAMLVLSISGTTVKVARGQSGTASVPHVTGSMVLAGTPDQFYTRDPSGACTATATAVTPWVNISTGNQWLCSTITTSWVPGFGNRIAVPQATTAVASVAGATALSGPLFHITGTNQITSWTLPVGQLNSPFCIIPDAAFTTTASNNIAKATTGVLNQTLCYTWDATNSKFVPSY